MCFFHVSELHREVSTRSSTSPIAILWSWTVYYIHLLPLLITHLRCSDAFTFFTMWLPSIFSSTNKSQTDVTRRDKSLDEIAQRSYDNFLHQPQGVQGLSYIALGSLLTYATMRLHRRYRRFKNSDWITPDVFAKKRWIKGKVTK